MNTDWIRPGVKAVICATNNYPQLLGAVVTIAGLPVRFHYQDGFGACMGVRIEERSTLVEGENIMPRVRSLKPYHEPGSWDEWNVCDEIDNGFIWCPEKEKVNE